MKVGIEVLLKKYEEEDDFHKAADNNIESNIKHDTDIVKTQ